MARLPSSGNTCILNPDRCVPRRFSASPLAPQRGRTGVAPRVTAEQPGTSGRRRALRARRAFRVVVLHGKDNVIVGAVGRWKLGATILIADDDRQVVQMVRLYLVNSGYDVVLAAGAADILAKIREIKPDLVILGVTTTGANGIEICNRIHEECDVPIIAVSNGNDDVDATASLEVGADDFLVKPFDPRELAARVKAVLRRAQAPPRPQRFIEIGELRLDTARRQAVLGGRSLRLRAKEFGVLEVLASQREAVVPREQILRTVWGADFNGDGRTLTVHVAWLRSKLGDSGIRLEAVRGIGYRLALG